VLARCRLRCLMLGSALVPLLVAALLRCSLAVAFGA